MALMTSMRERMHVVLWGLLFMFLLSMTIGGLVGGADIIDQLIGKVNPSTTIAQINGQNISPDYFNQIVNREIDNARANGQKINDFQLQRARNTAWDNLLQDVLVSQEVDRLGIIASDQEVIFHLENNPPQFLQQNPNFQTEGVFDSDKYKNALANPQGNEWAPIESFMKSTFIPNYKLQQILDESIVITDEDIRQEYIKNNLLYTIDGLHITSAKVPNESSEPSYDDVKAKYEATKSEYKHSELRNISFVSWKKASSKNDSMVTKKLAQDLYNRAKSGEDFGSLADDYSVDPGNQGSKGGDLGWFSRGRMVKPFEDAAFDGKKGQILEPIESRHGYHIIFIRDKKTENGKEQVLASHILLKIEISPTTLEKIKREAILFSYDAQDNGFSTAVSSHKLNSNSHDKLQESSFSIQGIGGLRSAVRFAFDGKIGDVSDIMENDQYFAVFTINNIIKPGIKPFKDVEEELTNLLKKEKVMTLTLEKAQKLMIDIASDNKSLIKISNQNPDLDYIKDEQKTLSQGFTSIGRSNYLTGALLSSKLGETIGPVKTNRGYAIVQLKAVSNFDSTKFEISKESLHRTIFNRKQNQYFNVWLENLKENSDIIDNRKYYF